MNIKFVSGMLAIVMLSGCLTGCGQKEVVNEEIPEQIETNQTIELPTIETPELKNEYVVDNNTSSIVDEIKQENSTIKLSRVDAYDGITYYYDQLNKTDQDYYLKIKEILKNGEGTLLFPYNGNFEEFWNHFIKIYDFVKCDNPHLIFQAEDILLNGKSIKNMTWLDNPDFGEIVEVQLIFHNYWDEYARAEAVEELKVRTNEILKELDKIESDYYKIIWLYNILVREIEYEHGYPWSYSAYGAIVMGQASCEGISEAFSYLLNLSGIESMGVTGTSENQGHRWSMVKLDEEWYHFDTTWDIDKPMQFFLPYTYFAVTEKDIESMHLLDYPDNIPKATATKYNFYKHNDLVAKKFTRDEMARIAKKSYELNPGYITIRFENEDDFYAAITQPEVDQWVPYVIQALKLSKWQYLVFPNEELLVVEVALFDEVVTLRDLGLEE